MLYEKLCSCCLKSLSIFNFNKSKTSHDGLNGKCKFCVSEYNKKYKEVNKEKVKSYGKEYNKKNKNKISLTHKEYRLKNKEEIKEKAKLRWDKKKNDENYKKLKKEYDIAYRAKNTDKLKKQSKQRSVLNKDRIREYSKTWKKSKRESDPKFNINNAMSCGMRDTLSKSKSGKSWKKITGYTVEKLMIHLESKFTKGMTWGNYGKDGWEIDHVIPVSLFKFDSYNHPAFKACWALENLQPLWKTTSIAVQFGEELSYVGNVEKGNKIEITDKIKELLDRVNT